MYKWTKLRTASRNRAFYRTLLFFVTIPVCHAVLVNRTIDNSIGDPVTGFIPIYQPQSFWADQTCTECCIQPDKAKAFDGTWKAAYYYPGPQNVNVTLQFTGVAIWVFFILPDFCTSNHYVKGTVVNITLDGQYAGTFSYHPDNTTDLIYNATIFHTSGLVNTLHELVIGTNDYPGSVTSEIPDNWLIFDRAIYTVDLEPSSSQNLFLSAPGSLICLVQTASQNASSSTTVALPSTTGSSSTCSTASTIPTPQSSSSNVGTVVGSTTIALPSATSSFSTGSTASTIPTPQSLSSKVSIVGSTTAALPSTTSSCSTRSTARTIPTPQNSSSKVSVVVGSTTVALPSTTSSSSTRGTASTTPTPQSSSSKVSVIVGSTLGGVGGLAVIIIVLILLVRHLRRAPPVRNGNAERILDIDIPLHHQPYYRHETPVQDHGPTQSKAARLREARQRELDERIQSAQHELDNLRSLRNASSAGDPSVAGPSRPSPVLALLRNEVQELRERVEYLQAQRESDWALGLSDEPIPPTYSQLSNTVR